jgi:hypothetical protein
MALRIETFSNVRGGNAFFKAVTHPLADVAMAALLKRLDGQAVALVDPDGIAAALSEIHDLRRLALTGVYVQDVGAIGGTVLGHAAQPVTALRQAKAKAVLVASFDPRVADKLASLLPPGAELMTLEAIRIPDELLSNPARYLDGINFATNFVFFRDTGGLHTRLSTGNYWSGYGAREVALWLALFDGDGRQLAQWREPVAPDGAISIDSGAVRARFGLPEFTGQLFLHATGIAGHDVVKYALDTYGEDEAGSLSCTHDANSWPADFYAGLPAPNRDERVTLWIQNSLPCPIPAGAVALNLMGQDEARRLNQPVPPFASVALDIGTLWPEACWPQQFEISAGKYFVRPRYEVERHGRRHIAHANVERTDLQPDPNLPQLGNLMGKGYLLPAPILPRDRWRTLVQPTPMARAQKDLPIALLAYDSTGKEAGRLPLGRLRRDESIAVDIDQVLNGASLSGDHGHLELIYDFTQGGGDGWLHALFRYEDRASGHQADSSFGAHIFNTALTYRDEPQSYSGRPPGLSTRLYLRLGDAPYDTFCHLIYPASTPWLPQSTTDLVLYDGVGRQVAKRHIAIPCSGSQFWRYGEMFDTAERAQAAAGGYILIRDVTCRLFGYHGLLGSQGKFSLDHMFGF